MFLSSLLPTLDLSAGWAGIVKTTLIFTAMLFAVGALIRLSFGKGAPLTRAVSASLSVVLVYLTSVLLYRFLPEIHGQLPQLPFVYADDQRFILRNLTELSEPVLYGSLVRLAMLCLFVNLLESLLPQGETILNWYLWRSITVVLTLSLYSFFSTVLGAAVPELFGAWAKYVILGCWIFILLTGALKFLLGIVLTAINPVVGALYAFFFSHIIGRQFSKTIITTLIMALGAVLLNRMGFRVFSFADFSLAAYGPACVIVIVAMYLFWKIL